MARDWQAWHAEYDQPGSRLSRRLAVVQACMRDALDRAPAGPFRVVSACAGEGRDLLGVLADHPRARDVKARLVELDPDLAARTRVAAPPGVEVLCADAGSTDAYAGAVPADLVLLCGVFGNVALEDIERSVRSLPMLCAAGATVIWTRHRRPPDRTRDIRRWLGEVGFEELRFVGSDETLFGVGAHRLAGPPQPFAPGRRLFRFVSSS